MPTLANSASIDGQTLSEAIDSALLIFSPPDSILHANCAALALASRLPARDQLNKPLVTEQVLLSILPEGAIEAALRDSIWRAAMQIIDRFGDAKSLNITIKLLPGAAHTTLLAVFDEIEIRSVSHAYGRDADTTFERRSADIERTMQSEKMASIGQLAAGVAHEINNPIGYVLSNLGTLQEYQRGLFALIDCHESELRALGDNATLARLQDNRRRLDIDFACRDLPQLLSESKEGIRRVQKIVSDLKEFARISGEEHWVEVDLHKGLDTAINMLWSDLKYKAKLHLDYGDLPMMQCQPTELNQVFFNVLLNASQAIGDRGDISIHTSCHEAEIWVDIADTGEGIADKHLSRIFEPFFTTKANRRCTGLGLSIAWGIVKKHHGRIEVDSRTGVGSRFRIILPIHPPSAIPQQDGLIPPES